MKNLLLSLLIALSFISVNAQRYAANLDMTVIKNYKKFEKSYEIYSIKKALHTTLTASTKSPHQFRMRTMPIFLFT